MWDASALASPIKRKLGMAGEHREKWKALFGGAGVIPIFGQPIKAAGEAILSLCQSKEGDTQSKFIETLKKLSEYMSDTQRAVFVIDPEKWMPKDSDNAWKLVVRELPDKIKLVFPQRPDDVLVSSRQFCGLKNVVRVPRGKVEELDAGAIDDLVSAYAVRTGQGANELHSAVARYKRHPYAVAAALALIEDGLAIEALPMDPTPEKIVEEQRSWAFKKGPDVVKLFEAYAILEVAVPDDVVEKTSGVAPAARKALLEDNYLSGLLREESGGRRIYHSILADYILEQMSDEEKKKYHKMAVKIYRAKLKKAKKEKTKPDELAAVRLPEHILATEGEEAFVGAFVNECVQPLCNLGLFDEAIILSERALDAVKKNSAEQAIVLGNLGLIYRRRGELDKAEEAHKKSLEINDKFGLLEGIASQFGNLGNIYQIKGELGKAEEMHKKALGISEELGLLEGMASSYGSLGAIYGIRGELDKAEETLKKALEIEKKLGRLVGMADDYGNLGVIYQKKGDLAKAEEMFKKSLAIAEKLGLLEGMANSYGNLGVIYWTRRELDKAEEMYKMALEIAEKIGLLDVMACGYGNLGLIYQKKGDLAKAEEMHKKSLEIEKKIGRLEGMANEYCNLGIIYQKRGESDKAEEMLKKSLEINEKIGRQEGMANQFGNLGMVYKQRGDLGKARGYWEKALDLFKKIGMPNMVTKVEGWIEEIKGK
jgi:tetratricopeptide (TPR) repeat protein